MIRKLLIVFMSILIMLNLKVELSRVTPLLNYYFKEWKIIL